MKNSGSILFGNTVIAYNLSFSERKTAAIEVHPNSHVSVIAPVNSDIDSIEHLLHKRSHWILKQQKQFATYAVPVPPRAYVSGESYRYLGRQYRLKVLEGDSASVRLERTLIHLTVPDKNEPGRVQEVLDTWFRTQATQLFQERLAICFPRIERLGVTFPQLIVTVMKTRWGSCTKTGSVRLNLKLVQAPVECIDYVVIHELCHIKEHNHGKQYYALLDKVLPDWRDRKRKLGQIEF